jgi:F-type H+-transporting ATPase subunit epsilon
LNRHVVAAVQRFTIHDSTKTMATLKLEIVTPEGVTCSESVEMVTLPGVDGEIGIYPQHVPLMTQIVPGELIVRKSGEERLLAVGAGFVEITGDSVSVLTDMAIAADSIDEAKAEEARLRAVARLAEKVTAEEEAAARASLANSVAHLNLKRRQRR